MRRASSIALTVAVAVVGGLAFAGTARAAVSCVYTGSSASPPIASIALTSPGDSATLAVAGDEITVNGAPCASNTLLGEIATTDNTEFVVAQDTSGGVTEVRIEDPAAFAPGFANEGDGSAEIEFGINLGEGEGDVLRIEAAGPDAQDRYEFGLVPGPTGGGNLNARAEDRGSEDFDLGLAGVEQVVGDGRALDDKIDADAGAPFLGPLPVTIESFGFDGSDTLRGGLAADLLHGGAGEDLLEGGAGRDVLLGEGEEDVLAGGEGPDRIDGGDDDDVADYRAVTAGEKRGLVADLDGGTAGGAGRGDRLVSIEGALGTAFADRIDGDGALNFIQAGGGADRLSGEGESDALFGSAGADALVGGGARDVLFGDAGADRISGELGKDVAVGGAGADRIETQKGVDLVDVAGGGTDVVDCGPGRDGYDADPGDRLRSCEVKFDLGG